MAYIGTTPTKVVSRQSVVDYRYTATAGQTAFTGADLNNQVLACNPADMDVHLNGVRLDATDWTATATTLTLAVAATAGDEVTVSVRQTFEVADTYAKTTADDRFVNASGDTVSGALAVTGDLTVDTDTLYVDSTNNQVGIGTSSPQANLEVSAASGSTDKQVLRASTVGGGAFRVHCSDTSVAAPTWSIQTGASEPLVFSPTGTEAMRIDSSGNLLVSGTSATAFSDTSGSQIGLMHNGGDSFVAISRSNTASTAYCMVLNRTATTDGDILAFRKQGTTVGSIHSQGGVRFGLGNISTGLLFNGDNNSIHPWNTTTNASRDNIIDSGNASNRWDDIYATNGTIQTSDRNEKQDIAELDEAEKRVAVAAKGLIRKYRWKDAVAEKGDDARIHVGIIAQDLQAAFAAEGLDASRYAMFISSTWWEADEVIPAVDEVLDDEGNVVTEAQPERTVTHHYETAEEAPEGATERTRLGVRYPELLAFIIGAM